MLSDEQLAHLAHRANQIVRNRASLAPSSDGPALAVILQYLINQEEKQNA